MRTTFHSSPLLHLRRRHCDCWIYNTRECNRPADSKLIQQKIGSYLLNMRIVSRGEYAHNVARLNVVRGIHQPVTFNPTTFSFLGRMDVY